MRNHTTTSSLLASALFGPAVLTLSGCASTDWRAVARNWGESACRSNTHCKVQCDPKDIRTLNDPKCENTTTLKAPSSKS
ncbi:MAG: hypothetical protein EAZ30_14005 [Betaproteobacteria bacterium]|nr:MAG: hypothetical protein EAZ30_14005 [Betaproteobacteria bacterium]